MLLHSDSMVSPPNPNPHPNQVQTARDDCASLAPVGCEDLCRALSGCCHMLKGNARAA